MVEDNAYMDNVAGKRSLLLSEEESLAGQTLLSAETCEEFNDDQCFVIWIQENFAGFMTHLNRLPRIDQDLLLGYYLLSKTQTQLALINKTTQTVCSFNIRGAKKVLVGMLRFGGQPPTEDNVRLILGSRDSVAMLIDINTKRTRTMSVARLLAEYRRCRDYAAIADKNGVHRPLIRKTFSKVGQQLRDSEDPDEQVVGWWIYGLTNGANVFGSGLTPRAAIKRIDSSHTDPDICGQFRIKIDDPTFDALFQPRAQQL
jgi:hypothetical protein